MKDYDYWRMHFLSSMHNMAQTRVEQADDQKFTPIEKIALLQLRIVQLFYGVYYFLIIPQCKIKDYRVDFLIEYSLPDQKKKLVVIECDGHAFHEKTKEQASKDKKRDRELQKLEMTVLRYSGSDIVNNPEMIMDDLTEILGAPDWAKPKQEMKQG